MKNIEKADLRFFRRAVRVVLGTVVAVIVLQLALFFLPALEGVPSVDDLREGYAQSMQARNDSAFKVFQTSVAYRRFRATESKDTLSEIYKEFIELTYPSKGKPKEAEEATAGNAP